MPRISKRQGYGILCSMIVGSKPCGGRLDIVETEPQADGLTVCRKRRCVKCRATRYSTEVDGTLDEVRNLIQLGQRYQQIESTLVEQLGAFPHVEEIIEVFTEHREQRRQREAERLASEIRDRATATAGDPETAIRRRSAVAGWMALTH